MITFKNLPNLLNMTKKIDMNMIDRKILSNIL